MKNFTNVVLTAALILSASQATLAATTSVKKQARADFSNKLLLIPCVEVTKTPFDGYYNVLMSLSGSGNGLDWKVKEAKKAAEGECDDSGAPSTASTDDLLKSMGLPTIAEMTNKKPEDDSADDEPSSQSNSDIANNINNSINNAINNATK